jgi:hypothetical protein
MSRGDTPRLRWLQLLARLHDGADLPPQHRWLAALARFPGREGLPRSLGSVLGAAVARFLPHGYRHLRSGFETTQLKATCIAGLHASMDGTKVLHCPGGGAAVYQWTGTALVLQAQVECDFEAMCMAPGGMAYAVMYGGISGDGFLIEQVVDVSLPSFARGEFLYPLHSERIHCVAADDACVFVLLNHFVHVVSRSDATLRHTIGSAVFDWGAPGYLDLALPTGLCVLCQGASAQRVAVAEMQPYRITVFSVQGALLRYWDLAHMPIACAYRAVSDELVVLCADAPMHAVYVLTGLLTCSSDVVVSRNVVPDDCGWTMVFCGETALIVDAVDGVTRSFV